MNRLPGIAAQIRAEVPHDVLPDDADQALFLLYALLAVTKGTDVMDADVHTAWCVWMTLNGRRHPSMVPFDELPTDVQAEDRSFTAAIRRVASDVERDLPR